MGARGIRARADAIAARHGALLPQAAATDVSALRDARQHGSDAPGDAGFITGILGGGSGTGDWPLLHPRDARRHQGVFRRVFAPEEFLSQARLALSENLAQYRFVLANFQSGFLFHYSARWISSRT